MTSCKRIAAIFIAALSLAACGTPPKFQERHQASPDDKLSMGSSPLVQQTSHMTQHLNADKSILYTQPYGGGGVGLGLLLGPIGVAANIAMIESTTKSDANKLYGKINLDPGQAFNRAAKSRSLEIQPTGSTNLRVTPYVYVTKISESSLNIAAAMILESGTNAPSKYMFQLPGDFTIEQLASLDESGSLQLQASIDAGFGRLLSFFSRESDMNAQDEQKIQLKSAFLTPRFDFELQGAVAAKEDDVTWVRTYGGVYGLQTTSFSSHSLR